MLVGAAVRAPRARGRGRRTPPPPSLRPAHPATGAARSTCCGSRASRCPRPSLPPRRAIWLGVGAASLPTSSSRSSAARCRAACSSSRPRRSRSTSRCPFMLVVALAYAAEALRRLSAERSARERLAIEAERKRIAWELHDSAKQRLHAAHLLVTSLHGRVPDALDATVAARPSSSSPRRRTWTRASPSCDRRSRAGASTTRCAPAPQELAPGRAAAHRRPRGGAGAAAAGRRARLPDRQRGAHQRAPPRRRLARSTIALRTPRRSAARRSSATTGAACPSSRAPAPTACSRWRTARPRSAPV